MIESLIANEFLYENEEYGFKVKNLTENEKLEWYKKIENLKEENKEVINEEELLFEMYKELIICEGKIDFKKLDFEKFLIFINSPYLTDVANDINRCIASLYMNIMKTGLLNKKTQLEELEMKAALLLLQQKTGDYIELITEQAKHAKQVKAELKRIRSIAPNPEMDELSRVNRWTILKTKRKINKEIRRKNKIKEKDQ
ncbi:hypothetical protein ACSW9O_16045 (plasmid) [Clostridium perfringens]